MKHHKYYRDRIASLLTQFELDLSAFNQRWLENKFYALDEERALMSRYNFKSNKHVARYVSQSKSPKRDNPTKIKRCKYCYKLHHTDVECRDRLSKRPPSMPEWVSKVKCNKCHKVGHLGFNCPPKYKNQVRKTKKEDRQNSYRDKNNSEKGVKSDTAAVAQAEFAGYTTAVIPSDLPNMYSAKPMSPCCHPHTCKACPGDQHKQRRHRKRRRKRGTPKNIVTDENKKRL